MGSIYIKDVTLQFDKTLVINSLTERISDGEAYAVLGLSGSGKTSLLKIATGLSLVNSGEVEVNGKNIYKYSQRQMLEYHKNCGFVFQNSALISNMSIYENLSLYYNYHTDMTEKEIYEKIKKYLDYVGFEDDLSQRPGVLSTGEKMLVNIVRAVSHEPEFLFWDSPLSNLDLYYQKKVKNIISDLRKEKKTMIIATGDFDFASSVADKIGILYKGRIIESGPPEEIRSSKQDAVKEFLLKE